MRIKNLAEYQIEKEKFEKNPKNFWEEKASNFNWNQKWNDVVNWDFNNARLN